MARAYKCDRCGGFYTESDVAEYMVSGRETYSIDRLSQGPFEANERIDLCPRCLRALDDFLTGGIVEN